MNSVELLSVSRASAFIAYAMENDMQVKIHRSTAQRLFAGSLARPSDNHVVEFSAEKYDKVMTFLTQNDQQVHYATAANTVGVYAIVRLLGDLRRQLRDYTAQGYRPQPLAGDVPLLTPRDFRPAEGAREGAVPSLNLANIGAGPPGVAPSGGVGGGFQDAPSEHHSSE